MIKFESLDEYRIVFSAPGCEDMLYLTPEDAYRSMKEIERGLWSWHTLTGKKIFEMKREG